MKKEDLELLSKIEKVEVSPFLYQKIVRKIQANQELKINPKFAYTLVFGFLLLLFVNIAIISNTKKQQKNSDFLETYELNNSNNLYE